MAFNEIEHKRYEKLLKGFIKKIRPPIHVRNQLDIGFEITNRSVEIYELRPDWKNLEEINRIPVAKTTYVKKSNTWKIYWKQADLKWHEYEPNSEVSSLNEFITIIKKDKYGCFWG